MPAFNIKSIVHVIAFNIKMTVYNINIIVHNMKGI